MFGNIGNTYLYKLLPDGTPSREGDNEYPILDLRDTAVLGYSVNRFKDPYSAWLLRKSGFFPKQWVLPVLEFLWDDPEVTPRDPSLTTEDELPRAHYFPGVGHLVMRDGWKPDSTWIEFDCGPYLAKHQHLDQNQISIPPVTIAARIILRLFGRSALCIHSFAICLAYSFARA